MEKKSVKRLLINVNGWGYFPVCLMKRLAIVALFIGLMTGCSSDNDEPRVMEPTEVTLTFSPYTMEAMTRTATSIASIVTWQLSRR